MQPRLSSEPARTDLTDRECAKLLGSLIGGLCLMAPKDAVRAAVRWWAEADGVWPYLPKDTGAALSAAERGFADGSVHDRSDSSDDRRGSATPRG